MSRFSDKADIGFEDSSEELDLDCTCAECGRRFNGSDRSGGHCRGGAYGGCCQSFRSLGGFEKHRTGKYEPNERRCLTPDELLELGWSVDDNYTWRMPAPAVNPWKKET